MEHPGRVWFGLTGGTLPSCQGCCPLLPRVLEREGLLRALPPLGGEPAGFPVLQTPRKEGRKGRKKGKEKKERKKERQERKKGEKGKKRKERKEKEREKRKKKRKKEKEAPRSHLEKCLAWKLNAEYGAEGAIFKWWYQWEDLQRGFASVGTQYFRLATVLII